MRINNFLFILLRKSVGITFFLLATFCLNAQVFINEVAINPSVNITNTQNKCLVDCSNPNSGTQYIELYNADQCFAADVGCFLIATPNSGNSASSEGSFRIPAGTTIPPLGYLSIGGGGCGTIIKLSDYCSSANLAVAGGKWFLDSANQYVGLFDASGSLVDAVYWTTDPDQSALWNNSSGLSLPPTLIANPPSCGNIGSIGGASTFPTSKVSYGGTLPVIFKVLARSVDASPTWFFNANPTINKCNGTCFVRNPFSLSPTTLAPGCALSDGSITLSPTPTTTYTYTWVPNVTSSNVATNIPAGSYHITVTAANGCEKDTVISLSNANGITSSNSVVRNPPCGTSTDGSIVFTATGGTIPYQYSFNGQPFSPALTQDSINAGTYSLVVMDANGCTYNATDLVFTASNGKPDWVSFSIIPEGCGGQENGILNISMASGGVPPYIYNASNLGTSANTYYVHYLTGTYPLVVLDNNGCTFDTTFYIPVGPGIKELQMDVQRPICGLSNGHIYIDSVVGGYLPVRVDFNNTGYQDYRTHHDSLSAGTYTITALDNRGCSLTIQKELVSDYSTAPKNAYYTTTLPDCDAPNGYIEITTILGGTRPLQYNMNDQGFGRDSIIEDLSLGTYPIAIRDINGCTLNDTIRFLAPNEGYIYAPNAFTPNDDRVNEKWRIRGYCIRDIDCAIFNRWGEYITRLQGLDETWDGSYEGGLIQTGVYVYKAKITFESATIKNIMGHIVVLRNE